MTNTHSRPPTAFRGPRAFWIGLLILVAIVLVARPSLLRQWGFAPPEAAPGPYDPVAPADAGDGSAGDVAADASQAEDSTRLGVLREVGNDVWVSTAGLRYTPGSEEGHRLKHVFRHDNDLPDRPGKHGVFDGDQQTLLAMLDEAYTLIKENSPEVDAQREGDRTVYEVDMGRRVGFVGGRAGARDGNPPARRIRLVLEGDRVITAFPY